MPAGERVREAPYGSGGEFLVLRLEIEAVDFRKQASGGLQLAIDKRRIEDQLRGVIGDLCLFPQFNLPLEARSSISVVRTVRDSADSYEL